MNYITSRKSITDTPFILKRGSYCFQVAMSGDKSPHVFGRSESSPGVGRTIATPVRRRSGQSPPAQGQTANPQSGTLAGKFLQQETTQLLQKALELEATFQKREQDLEQAADDLRSKAAEEEQRIEMMKREARMEIDLEKRDCKRRISQQIKWEKEELRRERRELEDMKSRATAINPTLQGRITLDVGGDKFKTEVRTLIRHPHSLFQELVRVAEEHRSPNRPRLEEIFIDRDSRHFRLILNFLRQGGEVLHGSALKNADRYVLHEILCEVKYYRLTELERLIRRRITALDKPVAFQQIVNECHLVKKPSSTAKSTPAKPQADAADAYAFTTSQNILIREKNLTGIVIDKVHFQHPTSFEGSILHKAAFRGCFFDAAINFTNCNLYDATFDRCEGVLLGDRLLITGASMERVTFNPPLDNSDDSDD